MQDINYVFVADGYEVWADGVFMRNGQPPPDGSPRPTASLDERVPLSYSQACLKQVAPTPLWVGALGTAPDLAPDRQLLALLVYRDQDNGIERERWVGVADIIDRRRVMALGAEGLPINGENAGAVVKYLSGCRFANQGKLPAHTVVSRSGLHEVPGGVGFLLGDRWITAEGGPAAIPDPRRRDPFAGAFTPKGSFDDWKKKWLELRDSGGPLFRWQMGAAFAAPLLKLMGQRTFLVHDFDKTGRGKSAKAKFLLSIYGNPQALMRTMNQTENAMIETFRYFTDLPVLMDELQVHKGERPFLIYALAGEKGKGRSTKTGGLQDEITHFRSVIFTTGEEPLIGSNDLGGQTNRVIEMRSGVQIPDARKLHEFAEQNYGHAGEEWLRGVVLPTFADPDARRLVRGRFESMMAQLQAGGDSQRVAAITAGAQAQFYAETYLLGIDPDEALVQALADARVVIGRLPDTDIPLWQRAVDAIRDDMAANPTAYLDTRDQSAANRIGRDIRGVKMTDGVALIPSVAAKFLAGEPHKFPVRQVFSDLAEMGFLSWDEGTKFHQQVRRTFPDGSRQKCYVIRLIAFEPRPLEALAQMLAEEKAAAEGGQAPEPADTGAKVLSIDELIRQRRTGSKDGEG